MNPMELEGALYLQRRQQEMQRDLQLRQMLLRDQIGRQQNMHQHRMYELHQQFAGQQALATLQRDEQVLQDQIMRRRQLQQQMQQSHLPITSPIGSPMPHPISTESRIADSLSANVARRPTGNRKRSIDRSDRLEGDGQQKYARNDSVSSSTPSANDNHRDELLLAEASMENKDADSDLRTSQRARAGGTPTQRNGCSPDVTHEAQAIEGFQALASQAAPPEDSYAYESPAADQSLYTKGTLESLLAAGKAEEEVDEAATVMVTLQNVDEISDSEPNGLGTDMSDDDGENSVSIVLPRFKSKLPQLPVEPEIDAKYELKEAPDKKDTDNKIEIERDKEDTKESEASSAARTSSPKKDVELAAEPKENGDKLKAKEETIQPTEYPYPVDTWWPSIATIRRERRMNGEDTDEENFVEDPGLFEEDSSFRADTRKIQSRLANDVKPGVFEKLPHCKIHRLKTRKLKGANIPDHAFCWQVTESYCNDIMVCCSICSTWRHAGCGGHYKPYSVRENIESKEPFVPVCDLCHAERTLLQDFPIAETRLERQRIEQLRRALSTSAVIRQAAFVKFGGTYKWPLGSVSGTHINGHTRSVLTRHDKAEKTWSDMTSRLGRGHGYRPKERSKVRTREFERLLICIEDAGM